MARLSPPILLQFGIIVITVLNASRAVVQWNTYCNLKRSWSVGQTYSYNGPDFPNKLPLQLRHAAMWFNATERYSLNATDDWHSTIPRGHGWVRLGPEHRPFAVSMYHQLHCIDGIRHALVLSGADMHSAKSEKAKSHANHCFNYLRQLFLCKADTTFEPTVIKRVRRGQLTASASGEGVLHVCRDWTQVRNFVADNSAQWPGWH